MAEEEFERAVEEGLRLGKRIYFGKDGAVEPPKMMTEMNKSSSNSFLPSAPMMYAVVEDPKIVDNPDMPSYQPYVHGRCDEPALIPLQMNSVSLEVDCYLDTAFITITGSWRVHCVMTFCSCDCRIAIPMGEQGSILGVEVEVPGKSYCTELTALDDKRDLEKVAVHGGFLKPHIFTLTVPQIDGGFNLSMKVRWSQKLVYSDGQFSLSIPYTFPEYVTPAGKFISKKEKIQLNVNAGPGPAVQCKTTSHPLKELRREPGKFSYEADVLTWSSTDFVFTYTMSSPNVIGGVLVQSPDVLDSDRREIFCCYMYPGDQQSRNIFRKEVVFVVDISGSMRGEPLESTKNALFAALTKLNPQDFFSVIAFSDETCQFSSSLEPATPEAIGNVTQWINMNFVAGGGTNILPPLNQALEMLSKSQNSIPIVLLITDGAVEDERHICDIMKSQLTNKNSICPRIYTFGIGFFCNHYFLRMLAILGRGHYDAAFDPGSIEVRIEGLFARASSIVLANIGFEFDGIDDLEVYPSRAPDLSSQGPLIISGRYQGTFPENLKAKALLADLSSFSVDLKVQVSDDSLLNKVLAKQQIEIQTAQAWFTEDKELEEKIAKVSVLNGIVSEYTRMTTLETVKGKANTTPETVKGKANAGSTGKKVYNKIDKVEGPKTQKILLVQNLGVGFGNITATAENIPPTSGDKKPPDEVEILVKRNSNCCVKFCLRCCCCACCIRVISRMNDQCGNIIMQFCCGCACLGCFSCCSECCFSGQDS